MTWCFECNIYLSKRIVSLENLLKSLFLQWRIAFIIVLVTLVFYSPSSFGLATSYTSNYNVLTRILYWIVNVLSRYVIVVKCEFNSVVLKSVHTLYCILCMVVITFFFLLSNFYCIIFLRHPVHHESVNLRNETFTVYFLIHRPKPVISYA